MPPPLQRFLGFGLDFASIFWWDYVIGCGRLPLSVAAFLCLYVNASADVYMCASVFAFASSEPEVSK